MSRESADPYVYSGTSVLKNKQNIREEAAFKAFEYEKTDAQTVRMRASPSPEHFDFQQLKDIHSKLFQDVYDWAGQPRTTDLSKGGTTFERPQNIEAAGERLGASLQEKDNLRGLNKPQFVEGVTKVFVDINAMHPFREGNGRTTREFLNQIAEGAGYSLDQKRIDNSKDQWNQASAQAAKGNLEPVKEIFSQAIRPQRSIDFEVTPKDQALARHPELASAYAGLEKLQRSLEQKYPGNLKAQDHFLSQARVETVRKLDQGQENVGSASLAVPPSRSPAAVPLGPVKSVENSSGDLIPGNIAWGQNRPAQTWDRSTGAEPAAAKAPEPPTAQQAPEIKNLQVAFAKVGKDLSDTEASSLLEAAKLGKTSTVSVNGQDRTVKAASVLSVANQGNQGKAPNQSDSGARTL